MRMPNEKDITGNYHHQRKIVQDEISNVFIVAKVSRFSRVAVSSFATSNLPKVNSPALNTNKLTFSLFIIDSDAFLSCNCDNLSLDSL